MPAPEKPTLDGVEERWTARLGARRHLPLRPHEDPRPDLLDRHAAADGQRRAPPGPRLQLHPHRHRRPLPPHARPRGLLPDGLGRQRPQRRAPRPAHLRRHAATRRSPTTRRSSLPDDAAEAADPDLAAQLRRAVRRADRASSSRRTSSSGLASACRSTGARPTRRSERRRAAPRSGVPRLLARRPRLPRRGAHAVGRRLQDGRRAGRARGPGAAGRVPPHRRSAAPTTANRSTSRRRDPSCSPRASRSSPIPTTRATSRSSARTCRTPLFDVEVPIVAHELADPEKGSGIAMICTFGDTTDVMWWRELGLPVRSIVGRDGRIIHEPAAGHRRQRPAWYRDRRTHGRSRRRPAWSSCSRESGDMVGEPKPITHPVKFWENGNRPLEIVTSRQWFIRNARRADELAAARASARAATGTPTSCGCATRTGSTASTATGTSPVSASSACRSRSGTRCSTTATADRSPSDHLGRGSPSGRSVDRRARRATTSRSVASPAGSSATPT